MTAQLRSWARLRSLLVGGLRIKLLNITKGPSSKLRSPANQPQNTIADYPDSISGSIVMISSFSEFVRPIPAREPRKSDRSIAFALRLQSNGILDLWATSAANTKPLRALLGSRGIDPHNNTSIGPDIRERAKLIGSRMISRTIVQCGATIPITRFPTATPPCVSAEAPPHRVAAAQRRCW